MSDLVDRLRDRAYSGKIVDRLCEEAADAIARLRSTPQGGSEMNDLVTILRDISHDEKLDDDLRQVCCDGSREIARLRLTDTERSAVVVAMHRCDGPEFQVLRGLLERLCHGGPAYTGGVSAESEAKVADPQPTLTDAERAAIADAADRYAEITPESAETAATLRSLLERMK